MKISCYEVLLGAALFLSAEVDASCARAERCCAGKDSQCFGFGQRLSGSGNYSSKCFCDEDCVKLGDCCTDIYEACPARPCEVGEWSNWSECGCGHSEQMRSRKVVRAEVFGGDKCPKLEEKQPCWVRSCKRPRNLHQHRHTEIALLLPATYGSLRAQHMPWRHWNWNLHNYYGSARPQTGHCARYEIVSQGHSCRYWRGWARGLRPGTQVCVECHPSAMKRNLNFRCKGEGMQRTQTAWSAMRVRGCHGAWKLLSEPRQCSCQRGATDFIFV